MFLFSFCNGVQKANMPSTISLSDVHVTEKSRSPMSSMVLQRCVAVHDEISEDMTWLTPPKDIQILIQYGSAPETFRLIVKPMHAVAKVKALIHRGQGVSPRQQILVMGGKKLEDHKSLEEAGVEDGALLTLLTPELEVFDLPGVPLQLLPQRVALPNAKDAPGILAAKLRTCDLRISTRCVNPFVGQATVITHIPSGSELLLFGRAEQDSDAMCSESGAIFACFQRWESSIRTNRVLAKRELSLRTDLCIAADPNGGSFVKLSRQGDLLLNAISDGPGKDIFSGMRLQVLDMTDSDWVLVDDFNGAQGWLRREHLIGLGVPMLSWAAPEVVLDDQCVNSDYSPVLVQSM